MAAALHNTLLRTTHRCHISPCRQMMPALTLRKSIMTNATEMKTGEARLDSATLRRVRRPFRSIFAAQPLPLFHALNLVRV